MNSPRWIGTATLIPIALIVSAACQENSVKHTEMCDASAAVAVSPSMFVVANDEDNVLRIYGADQPGPPVQSVNLDSFLKPDPAHPEADIEGAAQVGKRTFWITSHGRNKEGKLRTSRHRFFATELSAAGNAISIAPTGAPYKDLLVDLDKSPSLKKYHLKMAASLAPEAEGGLNIEGLAARPEGGLLIAFRNPVPAGKALLVPLMNPDDVINGKAAKLGKPIELALGARGVRSIDWSDAKKRYLIVAGSPDDGKQFAFYQWTGDPDDEPQLSNGVQFTGFNPEAIIPYPQENAKVQILSDDGQQMVDGKECKDAPVASRSFRSFWISP